MQYKLILERKSDKLDKLIEVYKKDPKKARVLFLNQGKGSYYIERLVLFEDGEDFEICTFRKSFGISITNRMYSSEKKLKSIKYKDGKFWFINNMLSQKNFFVQLTYNCVKLFFNDWGWNEAYLYLLNKFTWIRFIGENSSLFGTAFNTFTKNKLYNLNDALRHVYGAPLPVVKLYLSNTLSIDNNHSYENLIIRFKKFKQRLINIENLRLEMLEHPFFVDTLRLGNMLNKKVNCSWSLNRLVAEHDKWSIEVSDILAEFEELKYLNISKVYLDFAEFSNLNPLKTNQDLIREGAVQHHCVGSYSSSVDDGRCCIYHVDGFTLELRFEKRWVDGAYTDTEQLYIVQFRGLRNIDAPTELRLRVQAQIDEFNKDLKDYEPRNKLSYTEDLFGVQIEW